MVAWEGELLRERWVGHAKMDESVLGGLKQWDILSSAHFSTHEFPFEKSVRLPWWLTSLVWWLRLCTSNARGMGLIPGTEPRSHMPCNTAKKEKRVDMCICIKDSLCRTAETNTILCFYTPIKSFKKQKRLAHIH